MATPLIIERQVIAGTGLSILNAVLTDANTEYAVTLPSYIRQFSVKTRNAAHTVKISVSEGQSNTVYFSLGANESWSETMVLPVNLTLYCQSPDAGCILEITVWS